MGIQNMHQLQQAGYRHALLSAQKLACMLAYRKKCRKYIAHTVASPIGYIVNNIAGRNLSDTVRYTL